MTTPNDIDAARVQWPYFLTRNWWSYVLDDSHSDKDYPFEVRYFTVPEFIWLRTGWEEYPNPLARLVNYFARLICRWRGHPAGVWFYNAGGYEPDMHCKGCGEDLG